MRIPLASLLVLLVGCSSAPAPAGDPLAQPPASSDLTDVSADLDAVLEHGALPGACDRYRAGDPGDLHARLLCGKSMFFYETFGTGGVPTVIVKFLLDHFPDLIGPGFEKLGLIADPSSTDHLPLGLAPTPNKLGGQVDSLAFTCASCHFARLPDGRYAVGAPNYAYDYGKHILDLSIFPSVAISGQTSGHDPDAIAAIQPLLDAMNADSTLKNQLLSALLPLAGVAGMTPTMSTEDEHHYATWPSGTMDFLIAPLPVDDMVHTVSKISPLWSIPTPDELAAAGLPSAWLGWTGTAHSVLEFLHGFVGFGGGPLASWPDDALGPLADYLYSLRAPANPSPPAADLVERGRQLFTTDHCADCHSGPRGMGRRLYDYGEIGTDDAMKRWLDPSGTGTPCCNLPAALTATLTHQLKSPRLVGTWTMSRFLHDGAVPSLESLFCLAPRPAVSEPAMGAGGHDMTCTLPDGDKQALLAYLRAR